MKKTKDNNKNWITEKISPKEEIAVQFCSEKAGKTNIIAIITRDFFGEKYQIYEVNFVDKTVTLLGRANNPNDLEEKYIGSKDGNLVVVKSKTKIKTTKIKTKEK